MQRQRWCALGIVTTTIFVAFPSLAAPTVPSSLHQYDYAGYSVNSGGVIVATSGTPRIRIDLPAEDIVRVWLAPAGAFQKEPSYAVVTESWSPVPWQISDRGSYLRIKTKRLVIRIQKQPLAVQFYQGDDLTLIEREDEGRGMEWAGDGSLTATYHLDPSEHFYGLGQDNSEYLGTLDRRGTKRVLWTGQKINHGKVTADVPIPFMLSTGGAGGGYGLFFDNSFRSEFDLGASSAAAYSWHADGGDALYYFMYGPDFNHIIDSYTALTGRPPLPNLWTLGYMQSKCSYYSWEEIDEVIRTMRSKQIPFDSMAIDFDWPEQLQNFQWNHRWNGESPRRLHDYGEQGVKFMISQSGPMIRKDSSNFQDGLNHGIFATDGNGQTVTCGYYDGELMDFTAPAMKDWLWPQIKHLRNEGIRGWWLDLTEPEGEPPQTLYQGGPAARIHNVFSLLTSKTYNEMLNAADPNARVFILTRTGFAGIQRYGAAVWTGDIYSDYETFAAQVPALLNAGLSGLSLWTNDSGGFLEGYYKNSLVAHGRLYERWLQFSAFAPMARAHHVGLAEPYAFGPEVEESSRHYLQLRYRLLPYLYSYAWLAYRHGTPLVRPLVFAYQTDPQVVNLKDEFLFGDDLLVAPVFTEGATSRKVYLPAGNWFGYEDGVAYRGGQTVEVAAPPQRLPLFVKAGAILPLAPDMLHTGERPWDPLTLEVYPAGLSSFNLYADDGQSMAYQHANSYTETLITSSLSAAEETLTIEASNAKFTPHAYNLEIHLQASPSGVVRNQQNLAMVTTPVAFAAAQNAAAYWDAAAGILHVKFVANATLNEHLAVRLVGSPIPVK